MAEERISFSSLLGQSILYWFNLENSLFGMATACLARKNILVEYHEKNAILSEYYAKVTGVVGTKTNVAPYLRPLEEAFFAIENFRSKLKFVEKAFNATISDATLRGEWIDAATNVQAASVKRNTLAHPRYKEFLTASAGRRCVIVPLGLKLATKKSRAGIPPPGAIGLRELELTAQSFARADWLIQMLIPRIVEHRTGLKSPVPQLKPLMPQPRPLNEIVRQMLAGVAPRPQSTEA